MGSVGVPVKILDGVQGQSFFEKDLEDLKDVSCDMGTYFSQRDQCQGWSMPGFIQEQQREVWLQRGEGS